MGTHMENHFESPCDEVKRLRDKIFGNGRQGLVDDIRDLKESVRLNTQFREKWQTIENKVTWQLVFLVIIFIMNVSILVFR